MFYYIRQVAADIFLYQPYQKHWGFKNENVISQDFDLFPLFSNTKKIGPTYFKVEIKETQMPTKSKVVYALTIHQTLCALAEIPIYIYPEKMIGIFTDTIEIGGKKYFLALKYFDSLRKELIKVPVEEKETIPVWMYGVSDSVSYLN